MSTIENPQATKRSNRSILIESDIGMCLNCGKRLTLCGRPFSAEIQCSKCLYINVFRNSQKPIEMRPPDSMGF